MHRSKKNLLKTPKPSRVIRFTKPWRESLCQCRGFEKPVKPLIKLGVLLSGQTLQEAGREGIGFGPFFHLYFHFGGSLRYWKNSLLLCKGFMANLRWKMVLFSFSGSGGGELNEK